MCWTWQRRFSLLESFVILAILIVSTQQVVAVGVEISSRQGNSDSESRYAEHMENGDDGLNAYYGTFYSLKYPGIYDKTYSPIVERRSSSKNYAYRKGCIRRNGTCDNRPRDCCFSSSCRCNLWGSNCRCQRMGLFQKWG